MTLPCACCCVNPLALTVSESVTFTRLAAVGCMAGLAPLHLISVLDAWYLIDLY
jgi:hypothetical protein